MATPTRYRGKVGTALKKAAAILTTTGFFAAAVVLAAILWLPANAAPASAAVENQTSLLFALDTPARPAAKVIASDSLIAEDMELTSSLQPDLTTVLNSWTYTQSAAAGANAGSAPFASLIWMAYWDYVTSAAHTNALFNAIAHFQYLVVTGVLGILELFHSPFLNAIVFGLEGVQNLLSPYA
jgi:hypothetical protein